MKKSLLILSFSALFFLVSCKGNTEPKPVDSTDSSTSQITTETSTTSSESSSSQSSTSESSTTETTTSSIMEDPIAEGTAFILGKWKTKEADAHVILEDTYLSGGVWENFSDARGDTMTGSYEVLAYDPTSITLKKTINGSTTTVTYDIKENGNELSVYFADSDVTQNFVRVNQ